MLYDELRPKFEKYFWDTLLNRDNNMNYFSIPGVKTGKKEKLKPEFITEKVCSFFNLTVEDVMSKNKKTAIAHPRQMCFLIMRGYRYTFYEIADYFKSATKNHSTIIYGVNHIKDLIYSDKHVRTNVISILGLLGVDDTENYINQIITSE